MESFCSVIHPSPLTVFETHLFRWLSTYVLGDKTYVLMLAILAVSKEDIVPVLWNLRVGGERQLKTESQRHGSHVVIQLGAKSSQVGGGCLQIEIRWS